MWEKNPNEWIKQHIDSDIENQLEITASREREEERSEIEVGD